MNDVQVVIKGSVDLPRNRQIHYRLSFRLPDTQLMIISYEVLMVTHNKANSLQGIIYVNFMACEVLLCCQSVFATSCMDTRKPVVTKYNMTRHVCSSIPIM